MSKPKIALYWCSSCGGCEEVVVDLAENILKLAETFDMVFWPAVLDFKHADVEALGDGELLFSLINGAVRMSEQEYMVKLLRRKSKLVIANGSCACFGGIVGLANFSSRQEVLNTVYKDASTVNNPCGIIPQEKTEEFGRTIELPAFYNTVKSVNQVVEVDYYLPGCPTTPELIADAVAAIVEGKLPGKGAVLADSRALCDTCSRRDSKPERLTISEFKRVYETELDPERCFLEQGVICLGPATRGGCKERCIKGNMPCRGCFGPLDDVSDFGAKCVSMLASLLGAKEPEEIKKIMDSIPDKAGLFYKYSLATSLLRGRK